jgi:hypothetical protein
VILVARKSVRIGDPVWEDVEKLIAAGLVSDIALDTLARVAPAEANDEREQVAIFDLVTKGIDRAPSEDTKPVVWIVAHTKKGGGDDLEAVSGSAQRTGQADSVLMVEATRTGGRVVSSRVTFAKLREEPDEHPEPAEFSIAKERLRWGHAPKEDDERPLELRILDRLALGARTKNKLSEELGKNKAALEEAITNLFTQHRIRSISISVRGNSYKGFALRDADQISSTSNPDRNPDKPCTPDDPGRPRTRSWEAASHAG